MKNIKCSICKKEYDNDFIKTLISISESGKRILSPICLTCCSNNILVDDLIKKKDLELKRLDGEMS